MDGIILINKPKDYTSRDIVNIVSKKLATKKVGHTGTLDPMAEGVLVLCCGKALKIVDLITNYDKEYIAEVTLGIGTDTLDLTGNIISEVKVKSISKENTLEVLKSFLGTYEQEVPKYSAIKINGKKLYEYARNGIEIILPKRNVNINTLELITDIKQENGHVIFSIKTKVSKGTYIRSLIRDIGNKLGYPACMSKLIRTKQGIFDIESCQNINEEYKFLTIKEVLKDMEQVSVNESLEFKIRNGQILERFFESDKCLILNKEQEEIAIYTTYEKNNLLVKPLKMFN